MGTPPADTLDEVVALDTRRASHAGAAGRRPRRMSLPHRKPTDRAPAVILEIVRTGVAFVVVLGVLVFIHELGHYLAARWRGVHVEMFSIGFGPRDRHLARPGRHGVEARLAAARRLREAARPGAAGGRAARGAGRPGIPGRTFHEKSVGCARHRRGRRPGREFPAGDGAVRPAVRDRRPAGRPCRWSATCWPTAPAARAGLQADDRIVAIDGAPIKSFEDIQRIIRRVRPSRSRSGPARRRPSWTCRC